MGTLAVLLTPLGYLWVRHPLKRIVDVWAPLCASVMGGSIVLLWDRVNLFGTHGLVVGVNGLLQILAGFFISSLSVMATFSGKTYRIDDVFEGSVALLDGDRLTRRQFLCHLFAYLALESVFIYLLGILALSVASSIHGAEVVQCRTLLRTVFILVYLGDVGHLTGTMLIGLIFLSSRMSRVSARDRFSAQPKVNVSPFSAPTSPVSVESAAEQGVRRPAGWNTIIMPYRMEDNHRCEKWVATTESPRADLQIQHHDGFVQTRECQNPASR